MPKGTSRFEAMSNSEKKIKPIASSYAGVKASGRQPIS